MSVSIIIPVYNEEESVSECIEETVKVFKDIDYEVIIVNDGSEDNSHELILRLIKNKPRIKYLFYPKNRGYSYAIRQGFKKAEKDFVSILDADLQYPPEELLKMYDYALKNKAQFVIGVPKVKYYNKLRRTLSFFYNLYVSLLFNIKLKDANSLKLMDRKCLENINFRFEYGIIEIEMLLGFKMQKIPIFTHQIKVRERRKGKSKCSIKLIYRTLIDCLKLRFSKNNLIKR